MSGSAEVVHVAWGVSRAETVGAALRLQGQAARVIALAHALHVGPINPAEPAARLAWLRVNLRDDDPSRDWQEPEAPWTEATSPGAHPVYWFCLSDAGEHASFLAFTSRMAGRPFDIVDVTGVDITGVDVTGVDITTVGGASPIWSLGQLRPEQIVATCLYARRRPISRVEQEAASAAWSQLQQENAPLRVVRDGRLVSAPLTHFDPVLTRLATPGWELAIEVIARALDHLNFEVDPPGQGTCCEFLFARLFALGEAGILEIRGAGPGMRDYDVRRAGL